MYFLKESHPVDEIKIFVVMKEKLFLPPSYVKSQHNYPTVKDNIYLHSV